MPFLTTVLAPCRKTQCHHRRPRNHQRMETCYVDKYHRSSLLIKLRMWAIFFVVTTIHSAHCQTFQPGATDYARPAVQMVDAPMQIGEPPLPIFDPRDYGAKADGKTYDTTALQKAIDACAGTGGSVVLFHGKFLSAHLTLRSRMTFFVKTDAVLLGGRNPTDYPVLLPKGSVDRYAGRSLLYADSVENLVLDGGGIIDGQGPRLRMSGKEPDRPSLIRIFESTNVVVRNVTLSNPRMWTQIYLRCRHLLLDHLTVNSPGGYCPNLDGMDICDGSEVVVSSCRVNSDDDSICLKSMGPLGLQNILITNNFISNTGANAIKLGTSTSGPVKSIRVYNNTIYSAALGGLCIESVDGSDVSDFVVRGLNMYRVSHPIFIRLAHRTGTPGSITDVLIENVGAYETGMKGQGVKSLDSSPLCPSCTITGISKARIGRVKLKNCYIEMPGGLARIPRTPPEKETKYPQSNLLGNVPAYGIYVRHADDVVLENVYFGRYAPDARPWLKADDAKVQTVACQDLQLIKPLNTTIKSLNN